jgi:hypothetical protein
MQTIDVYRVTCAHCDKDSLVTLRQLNRDQVCCFCDEPLAAVVGPKWRATAQPQVAPEPAVRGCLDGGDHEFVDSKIWDVDHLRDAKLCVWCHKER